MQNTQKPTHTPDATRQMWRPREYPPEHFRFFELFTFFSGLTHFRMQSSISLADKPRSTPNARSFSIFSSSCLRTFSLAESMTASDVYDSRLSSENHGDAARAPWHVSKLPLATRGLFISNRNPQEGSTSSRYQGSAIYRLT